MTDAACRLAGGLPVGRVVATLANRGEVELAKRLRKASKARRLRAHPDALLIADLRRFFEDRCSDRGSDAPPAEFSRSPAAAAKLDKDTYRNPSCL